MSDYGLSEYDAALITAVRSTADYFEAVVGARPAGAEAAAFAKEAANWINGEFARLAAARNGEGPAVTPENMASLVAMFQARTISNAAAKQVLAEMFQTGKGAAAIVEEKGLKKVTDVGSLEPAVDQAIAANPGAVDDYLKGKETAVRFLVGQVIRASKGRADPVRAAELISEKLNARKS